MNFVNKMFEFLNFNEKITIPYLWDTFYKNVKHEQPFLYYLENKELKSFTYKELYAKSHCFAAYLLKIGLKKGNKILVISKNNPQFLIIDLACHLIGINNWVIKHQNNETNWKEIFLHFQPHFTIIEDYEVYQNLFELQYLSTPVVLIEKNFDKIALKDHLVLFDTAIEIGKNYWRENQDYINELKFNVKENDILFYTSFSQFLTHREFIFNLQNFKKYEVSLKKNNGSIRLLLSLLPFHLLYRYAIYSGIFQQNIIYLMDYQNITNSSIKKYKINQWYHSGKELSQFTNNWFEGKENYFLRTFIHKSKNKLHKKINNQNLPFGLKIQLNLFYFYKEYLKHSWSNSLQIHVLENELSLDTLIYWNIINIPVVTYLIDNQAKVHSAKFNNLNREIFFINKPLNFFF